MIATTCDLELIARQYREKEHKLTHRIVICAGTGCIANGSMKVFAEFQRLINQGGLNAIVNLQAEDHDHNGIHISGSGCQGFCAMGPLVNIFPQKILYVGVKTEDVAEIIETTLKNNQVVERLLYTHPATGEKFKGQNDIPFYKLQTRMVLDECGHIDPEDINEYIARGGYSNIKRLLENTSPEETCRLMEQSGLKGRGGAGFLTGKKWELTRIQPGPKKYVICNGDEGDPGAFMDRSLMEGNPHRVIEGMMIAAHAIGADEGYVYVRMEYPLAVKRMMKAIADAEAAGVLGDDIFGSSRSMRIQVMEGAGAFVCGEETALISSIEGKRGMPRPKPPFPAQSGLWGKPTVINNVETLATVPLIIQHGPEWFSQYGIGKSKGTKTFALTGYVANTGLIEVPFGTTLRRIIFDIGGGVTNNKGVVTQDAFKAVQIGGPSGGCLTENELDMPLDYDNLVKVGAMVGSGGLVVMNTESCIVQIARYFMEFIQDESCGKCVPCREGTKQILALLDKIIEGKADENTLQLLEELSLVTQKASLCNLGKSAPNPVLSTLERFRDEYISHIVHHKCPTNKCKALSDIVIDPEKCTGCTACTRKCPVGAISGEKKQPHIINNALCTKCGICAQTCKFDAVIGF